MCPSAQSMTPTSYRVQWSLCRNKKGGDQAPPSRKRRLRFLRRPSGRDAGTDRTAHASSCDPAITGRVLRQILLMIILGKEKFGRIDDLRRDVTVALVGQRFCIHSLGLFRGFALGLVVDIDPRTILRADIVTLPHSLCRIVVL